MWTNARAFAGIDSSVERWITGHRTAHLVDVAKAITFAGTTPVAIGVAVVAGIVIARRRKTWWPPIATVAAAVVLVATVTALKHAFDRARPPAADAVVHLTDGSMPSAHVARAAFVAALVAIAARYRRPWLYPVLAVFVVAVAWSRVELGVHWLTDTVVSIPLGVAFTLPLWRTARSP